ncbi:MAG: hybrid sensor histidine kinase/response regulator, partial [Chloroflexus sp.]|nr:hybrid sensor histidine kinase/response regulator [Chloroflexus sp.]
RLLARLNILLDSAKIEAGMLALQPEPFSLDTLFDDVLSEIAPLIRHNHNRLEIERPPQLGLIVADLNRLRQVLIHPLRFAAANTHRGAVTVNARRQTAAEQGELLEVTISDTGSTLDVSHIQTLLTPFTILPTNAHRINEGQGLALSRQLCELMGGSFFIDPRPPQGIICTIRIPIMLSSETDEPVSLPRQLPPPDLVIVTATDGRALQSALEQVGWLVQRESSLAEAIARLRRPPAALLIDLPPDRAPVEAMLRSAGWDAIPVIWLSNTGAGDGGITSALWPGDPAAVIHTVRTVLPRLQPAANVILVIEDEAPTRLMIRRALESEGWRVVEAGDSATGETIWRSANPKLVILDLLLPDGDGLALLQNARQTMATPVIVVTAKPLRYDEVNALSNIGAVVLQKGRYRRSDLLELVRKLAR